MEIFLAKNDQQTGPFSIEQLESMIGAGMIQITDMAWHSELPNWMPIHQVLGICPPIPNADKATVVEQHSKPKSKKSGLPAGFGSRFAACCIDFLVIFPLNFAVSVGFAVAVNASEESIAVIWNFSGIIISLLYHSLMESSPKMGTLGKMALGLIVVDYKGKRLSSDKAASRFGARFISALTLGIGFLMPLWTKKRQCLHDIIASTLVVHK